MSIDLAWCYGRCNALRVVIIAPGKQPYCKICGSTNTGPHNGGHKRTDRWKRRKKAVKDKR